MSKNLVIVESPAKSKTIEKYLGQGYTVKASVGHIRDLPPSGMGFNTTTFEAEYVPTERGKDVISSLKKLANDADTVWLATDDDREGEAIAWHLKESLGLKAYKRVTFNEITDKAIKMAFQNPGEINSNKVNAQQGRRLLDRTIGYVVSPALSNSLGAPSSAGRVQSPATRIIVELERRIAAFTKTNHFGVRAYFDDGKWFADWDTTPFVNEDAPYFLDRAAVERLQAVNAFTVLSCDSSESKRYAPAPFTTSTLQQAASVALGLSTDQTMKLAQMLYEGGYITYHRTDSKNLSEDAIAAVRAHLASSGNAEHIPESPNTWSNAEGVQGAHEAIRPSDIAKEIIDLNDANAIELYKLIRLRVLACQMKPAIYDNKQITLETENTIEGFSCKPTFRAKSRALKYSGWLSMAAESEDEGSDNEDEQTALLPTLSPGAQSTSVKQEIIEKTTQPPKRLTEAGLVKALEREGIGRPSTYAAIIKTIIDRQYVEVKNRKFYALPTGEKVVDSLVGRFTFIDLPYTRKMEQALDRVEQGTFRYQDLVKHTYDLVNQEITKLATVSESAHKCVECGRGLRRLKGGTGYFWGCTGHTTNECSATYPDDAGEPYFTPAQPQYFCLKCQCGMMRAHGKSGWYWRCSNTEICGHYMDDKNGVPVEREKHFCPLCQSELFKRKRKRKGKEGAFWGCSGYKDGCTFSVDDAKGRPQKTYLCRSCDKGYLRRFPDTHKGGHVWLCSSFKSGCKVRIEDKKGAPCLT